MSKRPKIGWSIKCKPGELSLTAPDGTVHDYLDAHEMILDALNERTETHMHRVDIAYELQSLRAALAGVVARIQQNKYTLAGPGRISIPADIEGELAVLASRQWAPAR